MSGWRRPWVFWAALSSGLSCPGSLLRGDKGVLRMNVVILYLMNGNYWECGRVGDVLARLGSVRTGLMSEFGEIRCLPLIHQW